jgi:predicted nucleic acid-binding protein
VPEHPPVRVYLDSNVLFSASYKPDSTFLGLWNLQNVTPVTSQYAIGETSRNISTLNHRERFESLLAQTQFISDADVGYIPPSVILAAKDQPILAAAIFASIEYLVTGDANHFGHLYNTTVKHVKILRPTEFLSLHNNRLIRWPLA